MADNKNYTKLLDLNTKLNKKRNEYQDAQNKLREALEKVSGLELYSTDFSDDGFGVGLSGEAYMGVADLLKVVKEKGTFAEGDVFESL